MTNAVLAWCDQGMQSKQAPAAIQAMRAEVRRMRAHVADLCRALGEVGGDQGVARSSAVRPTPKAA